MKPFNIKYPKLSIGGPMVDVQMKLSAKFKLVRRRQLSENECEETVISEFTNLITDNGLDIIATTGSVYYYCQVGTGTATPAFTDVALGAKVAHVGYSTSTYPTPTAAPYTRTITFKYTFNPGVLTVPITEIGVSPAITGNLFSRTLIKDTNGNPTSISLLSDEYLDIYYSLSVTPPSTDSAVSFTINGTQYNAIIRGLGYLISGQFMWQGFANSSIVNTYCYYGTLYTGALPISASNSEVAAGTSLSLSSRTALAYVNGQKKIQRTFTWTPAQGAFSIKSIVFFGGGSGPSFGLEFATPVPKTATQAFTLTFQLSWDRA